MLKYLLRILNLGYKMKVDVVNDEVAVVDVLPKDIFGDVVIVERSTGDWDSSNLTVEECSKCNTFKIGVESVATVRIFHDRIEVDTVTPRILDMCDTEMLVDYKRRKRKFAFDDLFLMSDTMKTIMGK